MLEEETLEQMLKKAGIGRWDLLIVGDGSGSTADKESGWGSISVSRRSGKRILWAGCANRGTVNFAEIMAYLQPLTNFANEVDDDRRAGSSMQTIHVHIITDSEYVKKTGGTKGRKIAKNAGLWSCFDVFARMGFVIHWHWARRESSAMNRTADAVSKISRLLIKDYKWKEAGVRIYKANPSAEKQSRRVRSDQI